MTIAITWAVLATLLGICAVVGWLSARADYQWVCEICKRADARYQDARGRANDAEHRLLVIEPSRHLSAKHARAAQLAQQAAKRSIVTARLEQGL